MVIAAPTYLSSLILISNILVQFFSTQKTMPLSKIITLFKFVKQLHCILLKRTVLPILWPLEQYWRNVTLCQVVLSCATDFLTCWWSRQYSCPPKICTWQVPIPWINFPSNPYLHDLCAMKRVLWHQRL